MALTSSGESLWCDVGASPLVGQVAVAAGIHTVTDKAINSDWGWREVEGGGGGGGGGRRRLGGREKGKGQGGIEGERKGGREGSREGGREVEGRRGGREEERRREGQEGSLSCEMVVIKCYMYLLMAHLHKSE